MSRIKNVRYIEIREENSKIIVFFNHSWLNYKYFVIASANRGFYVDIPIIKKSGKKSFAHLEEAYKFVEELKKSSTNSLVVENKLAKFH